MKSTIPCRFFIYFFTFFNPNNLYKSQFKIRRVDITIIILINELAKSLIKIKLKSRKTISLLNECKNIINQHNCKPTVIINILKNYFAFEKQNLTFVHKILMKK